MVETFTLRIPILSGDKVRKAYVYIPNSFKKNPSLRYPVMYMFDGQNLFFDETATYGRSWRLRDYLDYTDTDMIIAAIDGNDGRNNERLSEYSPYSFIDDYWGDVKGKGFDTMNWMVNFFKKYIDEHYPTLPDRENTWIGGSSMGGLMSYFALVNYNETFSTAVALSPSFWVDIDKLEGLLDEKTLDKKSYIYMDYGENEAKGRNGERNSDYFWRIACKLGKKKVNVTARVIPEGTHSEANWERQIPVFMKILLEQNKK